MNKGQLKAAADFGAKLESGKILLDIENAGLVQPDTIEGEEQGERLYRINKNVRERLRRREAQIPYAPDSELYIIGGILLDNKAYDRCVIEGLRPSHFWNSTHRTLYVAIERCIQEEGAADFALVMQRLAHHKDNGWLEGQLYNCVSGTFTSIGVEAHCRTLMRMAQFREVNAAAYRLYYQSLLGDGEVEDLLADVRRELNALTNTEHLGMQRLSEVTFDTKDGPAWGLPALDLYTYGVAPGELTVIAAGTGQGKSLLSGLIAIEVARQGFPVIIFSLEMTAGEWLHRARHAIAEVEMPLNPRTHDYTGEDRYALRVADEEIAKLDITLVDRGDMSYEGIQAACDVHGQAHLVVVDYLQLMDLPKADRDDLRIASATRSFKRMAMEENRHVLLLSQFNRSNGDHDGRPDLVACPFNEEVKDIRVPSTDSLKGSSAIAQDADRVVLLANHPYREDQRGRPYHQQCANHLEVFLPKQRNGLSGKHGTVLKEFHKGIVRRFSKEELASWNGGMFTPYEWLDEQGYPREEHAKEVA